MLFYFHLIINSGLKMATKFDYAGFFKPYVGKEVVVKAGESDKSFSTFKGTIDAVCENHLTLGKGGVILEENKTRIRSGGVQTPIRYDLIRLVKEGMCILYQR